MLKVTCGNCSKEFEIYPSGLKEGRLNYCSKECSNLGRKNKPHTNKKGTITKCENCGKEIYLAPYLVKEDKHRFCSIECCNEKLNPARIASTCDQCGKPIKLGKQDEQYKNHFCSANCRNIFRDKKIDLICAVCGKEFRRFAGEVKRSKSEEVYCSKECKHSGMKIVNKYRVINDYVLLSLESNLALIDLENLKNTLTRHWHSVDKKSQNTYVSSHSPYSITLHRFITNCPSGLHVDHINHNRLDNRKCNLRICTESENHKNTLARFVNFAKNRNKLYLLDFCETKEAEIEHQLYLQTLK